MGDVVVFWCPPGLLGLLTSGSWLQKGDGCDFMIVLLYLQRGLAVITLAKVKFRMPFLRILIPSHAIVYLQESFLLRGIA